MSAKSLFMKRELPFPGYSYDTDCIYINGTGTTEYEFYIQLNRCGTLGGSDHNKKRDAKFKNTEPTVSSSTSSTSYLLFDAEACLKFCFLYQFSLFKAFYLFGSKMATFWDNLHLKYTNIEFIYHWQKTRNLHKTRK